MSLTSQLSGGQLGAWCAHRFPGSPAVAATVAAASAGYHPVRPRGQVTGRRWAAVGGAFGQRMAFLVQPAPPYYSLYGLVRAGIVSRRWADHTAAGFPTHTALTSPGRDRALELRPIPGGWLDLGDPPPTDTDDYPEQQVLRVFFTRLTGHLTAHTPGGVLGTPGAEAVLARVCAVLTGWEDAYRADTLPAGLLTLHQRGGYHLEDLYAAGQDLVTELTTLAGLLGTGGALGTLRAWAGNPPPGTALGTAAPVFVHHWADGDLIITGPGGGTLLDVKTVARLDDPARVARWVWQLLAYAWLDTTDRLRLMVALSLPVLFPVLAVVVRVFYLSVCPCSSCQQF